MDTNTNGAFSMIMQNYQTPQDNLQIGNESTKFVSRARSSS